MKKEVTHTTLYRQYRPHSFAEVRGQEQVTKTLQAALKNKKIAHAYLFSGGRGTGKTSVARIFARELGVTEKDVYEIDAASNRGIDDIRELREGVNVMPFESPYKCYIIDEAHMLTKEAWNALLKTLEEPPAHVLFIMATTELHKVPDTIQSRCEVYSFAQPSRELLSDIVIDVAKKEGFTLERPAAELVALLADGSFRDALSALQKVLSVSKGSKNITSTDVEETAGAPRGELVRSLVSALAEKNAAQALTAIQTALHDSLDMRLFTRLIMMRLRVVLLLRFAPDLAEQYSQELGDADLELVKSLAKNAQINSDTLRTLLEAYERMAYAAITHLPLELAVVDICEKK